MDTLPAQMKRSGARKIAAAAKALPIGMPPPPLLASILESLDDAKAEQVVALDLDGKAVLTSKAIAGYMTTAKGKRLAFAAFVNGVHMKDGIDVRRLGGDLGKLCEIVHVER